MSPGSRFLYGRGHVQNSRDSRYHTGNLTDGLACSRVCERQYDSILHSPSWGKTMNFETTQPLLNSFSDVYTVFAKRHTRGKVTHVFVSLHTGTLSLAVVPRELIYTVSTQVWVTWKSWSEQPCWRKGLDVLSLKAKLLRGCECLFTTSTATLGLVHSSLIVRIS